jgi:CBS domain containing-hemolysin-like protein
MQSLLVLALFAIGLRLSAFFSGGETGFYRLSLPRLSIDAEAGDRVSRTLMWFARHPPHFVATTLVGNNLANYITTYAISLGVLTVYGHSTETIDVLATMLLSPLIFLFGELLPKNLYYRAPLGLLRRDAPFFLLCYYLFLPLTLPLVQVTRLLERFSHQVGPRVNVMLGRSQLVQLISEGRREGVLTDVQSRLANGVLQLAPQPVTDSLIPADRVLGVGEDATRDELSTFARTHGTSIVSLRRSGAAGHWFAYVRSADLSVDARPVTALRIEMPVISADTTKLDALQQLQTAGALQGVVIRGEQVLGVIRTRGLVEQLFRPALSQEE